MSDVSQTYSAYGQIGTVTSGAFSDLSSKLAPAAKEDGQAMSDAFSNLSSRLAPAAKAAGRATLAGGATGVVAAGRVAKALVPRSMGEVGLVLGGVAGLVAAIAFNLPTDEALLVILGLAVVGAVVGGIVIPALSKAAIVAAL
jgi:hypothetical protein